MKEKISAFMDGELEQHASRDALGALASSGEAREAWAAYHLIGDAMRGTRPLHQDFAARLSWRLAEEPTVLAPRRLPAAPRKWVAASAIAASVAAVAFVGWVAVMPQPSSIQPVQVAKAPAPAAPAVAKPVIVPLPTATNDYLLAHQGFSPRVSLQGMAPYVRTVSDPSQRATGK
jgi:sigma-E factor negative regulatory protein RseA